MFVSSTETQLRHTAESETGVFHCLISDCHSLMGDYREREGKGWWEIRMEPMVGLKDIRVFTAYYCFWKFYPPLPSGEITSRHHWHKSDKWRNVTNKMIREAGNTPTDYTNTQELSAGNTHHSSQTRLRLQTQPEVYRRLHLIMWACLYLLNQLETTQTSAASGPRASLPLAELAYH